MDTLSIPVWILVIQHVLSISMLIILIRLPPFTILNVNYVNTTVSGALSSQTTAQYAVAVRLISWPHTTGSFLPIITLTAHV